MDDHPETLTTDDELEDTDDRRFELAAVDVALLRSPVVLRALAGICIATLVLAWPERTDQILARLIGLGLLAASATALWTAIRGRGLRTMHVVVAAAGSIAGLALVAAPTGSETVLARLVGVALVVVAVRDLLGLAAGAEADSRSWIVSRSAALLGAGLLVAAFPNEVFAAATTLAALVWIGLSAAVIAVSLDARTGPVTDHTDSTRLIAEWLADRPKSIDDRRALYDKILYDGPATTRRIARFFTLMAFASVIASMGVITDSTAVVIGAMLIAPLMTPLMGMAISLVMGWPRRLTTSATVAGAGIVFAIGIGVLVGLGAPAVIDTTTNSQIVARSSPTVLDLLIALAAGAAGAYGLSRPDVSDSLPGVAIAISLVPPLSVVGIAYSQGDWVSGNGALLLFATNMLAILVMGGVTFVVTGVTPIRRVTENQHRVRTSIAAVATLSTLVVGALLVNGAQITADLFEQSSTERTIERLLVDFPDHSLVRADLSGDTITATLVGPLDGAPTARALASELSAGLGRTVTADVRLIVEQRDVATSDE